MIRLLVTLILGIIMVLSDAGIWFCGLISLLEPNKLPALVHNLNTANKVRGGVNQATFKMVGEKRDLSINKWFLTLSFKTWHFSFHWAACVVEWHSFLVCWSCECIISVLREDQFLSIIASLFLTIIFIIIIIIVNVFSAYRGDKAPRSSVICCCPGINTLLSSLHL